MEIDDVMRLRDNKKTLNRIVEEWKPYD